MNLDQQSDRQDHSVLLRLEGTFRELTRHRISPINAFLSGFCTHFLGELSFHLLHCLEQTIVHVKMLQYLTHGKQGLAC